MSGFRQGVKIETFSVLGYYAAQTGSYIATCPEKLTAPLWKVGRILYPETSVCYITSDTSDTQTVIPRDTQ